MEIVYKHYSVLLHQSLMTTMLFIIIKIKQKNVEDIPSGDGLLVKQSMIKYTYYVKHIYL